MHFFLQITKPTSMKRFLSFLFAILLYQFSIAQSTQLELSDCGAIDVAFDQFLTADNVPGPGGYDFLVEEPISGYSELLHKPNRKFKLEELTGPIEYSTTYEISVRKGTSGPFGPICPIATEAFPTTQLMANDCGVTGISPGDNLNVDVNPDADSYVFRVVNELWNIDETITTSLPWFRLNMLGIILPAGAYEITVSIEINGTVGPSGPVCIIGTIDNGILIEQPDIVSSDTNEHIYDRFGNTYGEHQIVKILDPSPYGTCNAGIFQLDFTGGVFGSHPNAIDMMNTMCQVFTDLSELLVPTQCAGTTPTVYIEVTTAGMPPGALAGASQYYVPCGNEFFGYRNGLIEGDVWKAINTGVNDPTNYDGFVNVNFGVNWNYNYTVLPTGLEYDLYSVILHEGLHLIGFASLIRDDGLGTMAITPTINNLYSRYDTYLYSISAGQNVISWDGCYATSYATTLPDLTLGCTNLEYQGVYTGPQPVHAPDGSGTVGSPPFAQGTSISHFDNTCTTLQYVMHPSIVMGEIHRTPLPEEVTTLCDLGYETSGTFGVPTSPFYTTGLPSCGSIIAGVSDGSGYTVCDPPIIITECGTFNIDPIANDINAISFDCLELMYGGGTILTSNGNTTDGNWFDFTPSQTGVMIFNYIPIDAFGNRGNVTCIKILVQPCPGSETCAGLPPNGCNQICDLSDNTYVIGSHGSRDVDPLNSLNLFEVGMKAWSIGYSEGILLWADIQPGVPYIFSYTRRRVDDAWNSGPFTDPVDEMHVRLIQSAYSSGIPTGFFNYAIPPIPSVSFQILEENNITNTTWEQVTVCFTVSGADSYDWLWIYPEINTNYPDGSWIAIKDVQLIEDNFTAGLDLTPTCPDVTIGVPVCEIINQSYTWTDISVSTIVGTSNPQSVTITSNTTFELERFFPPNPSTLVYEASPVCVNTDQMTVDVSNILQVSTISVTNESCAGANDGSIDITVSNGATPYLFDWDIDGTGDNDDTEDLSGLPPGTYNVLVIGADGCVVAASATVNAAALLSATVITTPATCSGSSDGTISITATGGTPPYQYSIDGGITFFGTNVFAGLSAGTYTVVVEDINGCKITVFATVADGPNLTLNEVIIDESCVMAYDGSIDLMVSGGTTPYTYSWTGPGGFTASTEDISGLTTGAYDVTVIDANGCTGMLSIVINQVGGPDCCEPVGATIYVPTAGEISSTYAPGFGPADIVALNGDLLLDSDFDIDGSELYIAPGVTITVPSPWILTITNAAYLHGCPDMWEGIVIDGGTLIVDNGSIIEDGINAVRSLNGSTFTIDNATFNKNRISVKIDPYTATTHPGTITATTFDCSVFGVPVNLEAPYAGDRAFAGVYITNNLEVNIGDPIGGVNQFMYLRFGIHSNNASLNIYNNIFENIVGPVNICPIFPGILCPPVKGMAVYAENSGSIGPSGAYTINCGDVGSFMSNKIEDCRVGVYAKNFYYTNIIANKVIANTAGAFPEPIGTHGIGIIHTDGNLVNTQTVVNQNTCQNLQNGIVHSFVAITAADDSKLQCNQNLIFGNWRTVQRGIVLQKSGATGQIDSPDWEVNNNTLQDVTTGIYSLSMDFIAPLRMEQNLIDLRGTDNNYGIRIQNGIYHEVNGNIINGVDPTTPNVWGIDVTLTPWGHYDCNEVRKVWQGIRFTNDNTSTSTWNNLMEDCYDGWVVKDGAIIGPQGSLTDPSDNRWVDGTFLNSETYVDNSPNMDVNGPLYVRTTPAIYEPTLNDAFISIQKYAYPTSLIPSSGTLETCTGIGLPWPGYKKDALLIAEDSLDYLVFPEGSKFNAEQQVYKELERDSLLRDTVPQFLSFYNEMDTAVIGIDTKVDACLSNGEITNAQLLNNSINPMCSTDQTCKDYNQCLINLHTVGLSSADIIVLEEIAHSCPLEYGAIVYEARALLNEYYFDVMDYPNYCGLEDRNSELPNETQASSFRLYPNPTNGLLTIQIDSEFKDGTAVVYDITGKEAQQFNLNGKGQYTVINLGQLERGIYVIQVAIDGTTLGNENIVVAK